MLRSTNSQSNSGDSFDFDRKSLMYAENETAPFVFVNNINKQIDDNPNVKHTDLFMQGHGNGSVFLDISGCDIDKTILLRKIAEQYPTCIGVLLLQTGDREFAEINFDPNDKSIDNIQEKGVCFDNSSVIIPCKAIDNNVDIVYLSLFQLPFTHEKELAEILEETLSEYGDVLDVGIFFESYTKTFMCTGYCILNVFPKSEPYKPLCHKIPCPKSFLGGFYATWKGMPAYCQYCHVQDHTTNACPDAGTKELIWKNENIDIKFAQGLSRYMNFLIQKKRKESINVDVKREDGRNTRFKIKRKTELRKLMVAYCKKHYLSPPSVQFFYKDQPLAYEKTANELNMEDSDVITVKIKETN